MWEQRHFRCIKRDISKDGTLDPKWGHSVQDIFYIADGAAKVFKIYLWRRRISKTLKEFTTCFIWNAEENLKISNNTLKHILWQRKNFENHKQCFKHNVSCNTNSRNSIAVLEFHTLWLRRKMFIISSHANMVSISNSGVFHLNLQQRTLPQPKLLLSSGLWLIMVVCAYEMKLFGQLC